MGDRLSSCHQFQAILGPSSKPEFSKILSLKLTADTWLLSGDNNLVPCHLWWTGIVLKQEKSLQVFRLKLQLKIYDGVFFEETEYC